MKVTGFDHVTVVTPGELEDETVAWYTGVLGLVRLTKPEGARPRGAWFAAGDVQVHVSVDEHNPPRTAHFGLLVDDFDELIARLRAAGCHIEQARPIPGRHRCYTRDPAGNRIELASFDEHPADVVYEERA
jgi:catechol 2,3-dioxygenase-like lactoylglutathione lyase family enzyme